MIAFHVARHGRSVSRRIAAPYLRDDQVEVALIFPVTTERCDHPQGYEAALAEFYDRSAASLAVHLDAGRDVAVLCEGDPFFYGSYMYLHERLAAPVPDRGDPRRDVVLGRGRVGGDAAGQARRRPDRSLPGTLPPDVLAARLRGSDAAVVLKLGRTFDAVREAAERAGRRRARRLRRARERPRGADGAAATSRSRSRTCAATGARCAPGRPSRDQRRCGAELGRDAAGNGRTDRGEVSVVGLGPAGRSGSPPRRRPSWPRPSSSSATRPYLARVPVRPGQRRHASDNRVEAERARQALELAADGARVAVVSSGDPGIFAMATAVLEALDENGDGRGERRRSASSRA